MTCIADDESFLAPWLELWPTRRALEPHGLRLRFKVAKAAKISELSKYFSSRDNKHCKNSSVRKPQAQTHLYS